MTKTNGCVFCWTPRLTAPTKNKSIFIHFWTNSTNATHNHMNVMYSMPIDVSQCSDAPRPRVLCDLLLPCFLTSALCVCVWDRGFLSRQIKHVILFSDRCRLPFFHFSIVMCFVVTKSFALTCCAPFILMGARYYYSRKVILSYLECALHTDMADIEAYYMKPTGKMSTRTP